MDRANKNSQSKQTNAVRQEARKIGRPPGWLRLNKDRGRYEVIQGADIAIRTMFKDAASGIGADKIKEKIGGQI